MTRNSARGANGCVARHERHRKRLRRRDDQRIERIARESQLVGEIDLLGGLIERLVRWVAEEIVEEVTQRAPQVDAAGAGEQPDFPDDRHWDIDERLLPLARLEMRGRPASQGRGAQGVEQERVRVGHGRLGISHGGARA